MHLCITVKTNNKPNHECDIFGSIVNAHIANDKASTVDRQHIHGAVLSHTKVTFNI